MYHANKNNVTRIFMTTKYPILKHRVFFKTLTAAYHPFILDGLLSPIPTGWIVKVKVRVTKNMKATV